MYQKWAVIILIHAEDAKTRRFSNIFLDELKQTADAAHLKMFVLRNTFRYSVQKDMNAVLSELVLKPGKTTKELNEIKQYGKINLGSSDQLSIIFDDVLHETGEDCRFIVITWDHGYSFGIFNGEIGGLENFDKSKVFSFERNNEKNHVVITNLVGAIGTLRDGNERSENGINTLMHEISSENKAAEDFEGFDLEVFKHLVLSDVTDMLTPEEISTAITNSFSKKIDILIMMNCWMQSVETCYALEESVETLIAATSTLDFIGYDYIDFIGKIVSDPDIKPYDLSKRIVTNIEGKYKKLNTEIAFKEIAVSAIRLSRIRDLKEIADNFSTSLDAAVKTNLPWVNKERGRSFEFTHDYLPNAGVFFLYVVDLFDVISRLHTMNFITDKDIDNLTSWLNDYMIINTIGGNFTNETKAIGIYFPNNRSYTDTSTYYFNLYSPKGPKKNRKRFSLDSRWSVFIENYNKML